MPPPNINEYELFEVIGTGSYSTVCRARSKTTKNYVAVKTVSKTILSPTSTDNLLREIKLLKTLKHKNIVEMVDFTWNDRNIYIIMELCTAGDLSKYIKKHRRLPEPTCKFFLKQLSQAVLYMRSNNVSHFDLKPHNLLLTNSPGITLKVADFGFAQHLRLGEKNCVIKGSPLYMAPEILLSGSYNPLADLWSIGVILFECLFGKAPYSSGTLDELMQKIKSKQKIEIPKNYAISDECNDFLCRLLVHDPNKRISFDEFFGHSFLKSIQGTEDNLTKAIEIVTKAVQADEKQHFEKAYHLYCKALDYFLPAILDEADLGKKDHLRDRANKYMERAEEIKIVIKAQADQFERRQRGSHNRIVDAIRDSELYTELYSLCSSSPPLQNAMDIGRKGELYLMEKNYKLALDNITTSLSILVPLLGTEPSGHRRELLYEQIQKWMENAEYVKAISVDVQQSSQIITDDEDDEAVADTCTSDVTASNKLSCCVQ